MNRPVDRAIRLVRTYVVSHLTCTPDVLDIEAHLVMQGEVNGAFDFIIAVTYPVSYYFRVVMDEADQTTIYAFKLDDKITVNTR
ncbi:MAG: hypothetical protein J6S67_08555 [Methanobrevibacter sp.]|nr:hypothetical protein [Methanobrevibacter sp.]